MNELKMNGFNELAMDEMMAVDGGSEAKHTVWTHIGSAAAFGLSHAAKGTVAAALGYAAGAVLLVAGQIYINYKYAPRTVPKNRHHR